MEYQKITCEISTKGRTETTLPLAIASIIMQTRTPDELLIFDDNDGLPMDMMANPLLKYLLFFAFEKQIVIRVFDGHKLGQHYNHEWAQKLAEGDLIWRMDDDVVAEPTCLENLLKHIDDPHVGAVAPIVLFPSPTVADLPATWNSSGDNAQWHYFSGVKEAEHLYSVFLYRKGITHYDLTLSRAAHREETIFSMKLKRAGYKLLIEPKAVCRHFRFPTGGIRSAGYTKEMFDHDDRIFDEVLKELQGDTKIIHLNNGIGDHLVAQSLLPELRNRGWKKFIAATCHDVFGEEPDVETITIAKGNEMVSPVRFNVYHFMSRVKWKPTLKDMFETVYL